MQFDGVKLREQGINFAIVVVKPEVLTHSSQREETRRRFSQFFDGVPTVLMTQNNRGIPTYHGRTDIVNFLSSIDFRRIPFKHYSIN
jgi:hypothetical protein